MSEAASAAVSRWSLDLEAAIPGALMKAETIEAAATLLTTAGDLEPAHFRHRGKAEVFRIARGLIQHGALADPITVKHRLAAVGGRGDPAAFVGSLLEVPRTSTLAPWAELVRARASDADAPDAEREPEDTAATRGPRFEWATAFLARTEAQPERPPKIHELWPGEGVFLRHGRPRSMKSLGLLEECLAATSNSGPAYNCERFVVPRPMKVAFMNEEESERVERARLHWLMAGKGITDPGPLALLCRPGWNLETELGAESLMAELHRLEPEVLVIDPARASMPGIDGGPKDGTAGAMLVRRILRETSVQLIGFGAHDTKPGKDGADGRAGAEKASGGVLFSIADAPIGLTRKSDRETLAWPSHFKQGPDPAPFVIRFESAAPTGPFREFVRAVAVPHGDVEDRAAATERDALLRLLDAQGAVVTREAEAALPGARNGVAARHLAALEVAGKVRSVTGKGPLAALAERLGRKRWPANAVVWMRSEA